MDMDSGALMQSKDACFKLFGRTIPLPEIQIQGMSQSQPLDTEECGEIMKAEGEYSHEEESEDSTKVSEENHGNDPTPVLTSEARDPKLKEDQVESGTMSDEKSVKKPEKILPCPRCNSSETKFCYFNNYNVHQPRHFCKNCQRYWTAGGTMRNVPVGAGRRKNKHLTTQYRQMMVSSQLMPNNRMEAADSGGHRPPVEKGTVLKFSPDATLRDSVETVLNLKGQSGHTDVSNSREHMEELSPSGSSITASSFQEPALSHEILQRNQCGLSRPFDNLLSQQPLNCYPVPPWSLPWNSGWNGVPLQLIPASYLGCVPMPIWPADQGFVRGANGCSTSSFSPTNGSASNSSPTLGKHSRDTNSTSYDVSGPCVIVPKLMRIDEPNEGSNSPILTTLGICPGKKCPQPNARAGENASESDANQFLEANPAALSRSHIFQEST